MGSKMAGLAEFRCLEWLTPTDTVTVGDFLACLGNTTVGKRRRTARREGQEGKERRPTERHADPGVKRAGGLFHLLETLGDLAGHCPLLLD